MQKYCTRCETWKDANEVDQGLCDQCIDEMENEEFGLWYSQQSEADDDSSDSYESDLSSLSSDDSSSSTDSFAQLPKPTKPLPRAKVPKAAQPDIPIARSAGPEKRQFDFGDE